MLWPSYTARLTESILVLILLGLLGLSITNIFFIEISKEITVEASLATTPLESQPPTTVDQRESMSSYKNQMSFINSIEEILGSQVSNYGVYIKDLETGQEYGINQDQVFAPASISKLPYGILTFKHIDEGKLSYYNTLTLQERHKFYKTDPLYNFPNGSRWTIKDLLRLLLVDSDNVPMAMLEEYFGGVSSFNKQAEEIGVGGLTRYPHQTTPRAVGDIFEKIYNGELLSQESNDQLKEYLSRYKVFSSDRIRRGVVQAGGDGNQVVHKIGNLGGVYQDAGYVLSPGGDFIIVTLNQNRTPGQSVVEINAITRATYEHFNR